MNITSILQFNQFIFSLVLIIHVVEFDFSSPSMQSIHHRDKRELTFGLNATVDRSIKTYFLNRHCIKYSDIQKPFQFNGKSGQIDIGGKLRLVVSINALNSLTDRFRQETYTGFPLYFLTTCTMAYIVVCLILLFKR